MEPRLEKIINAIFLGLILALSLKGYSSLGEFLRWTGIFIVTQLLLNYYLLKEKAKNLIFPTLFLLGLFGTLAAISSLALKILLALLGSLLYWKRTRLGKDLFPLSSAFLLLTLLWSVNFFFTPPWWLLSLLSFSLFFLWFWARFSLLRTLLFSLIVVEISWAVQFLPVHFLTAAVIIFAIIYLMYMFTRLQQEQALTRQQIYFQTGMMVVLLLLTFLSSAWQPIK